MKYWIAIVFVFSAFNAFAGNSTGNGGDICEDQFKFIRDQIQQWILGGGEDALTLPAGISAEQYKSAMLQAISNAEISCADQAVSIGQAEKTCINYKDTLGIQRILCNESRFLDNTPDEGKYILVHHELAGLAGLEVNDGEDSNYRISDQVPKFLTAMTTMPNAEMPNLSGWTQVSGKEGVVVTLDLVIALSRTRFPNCSWVRTPLYQEQDLPPTCQSGDPLDSVRFDLGSLSKPGAAFSLFLYPSADGCSQSPDAQIVLATPDNSPDSSSGRRIRQVFGNDNLAHPAGHETDRLELDVIYTLTDDLTSVTKISLTESVSAATPVVLQSLECDGVPAPVEDPTL